MSRVIRIPQTIEARLKNLTQVDDETNGVLLYEQEGNVCNISTLFMTGHGTPGHVIADPNRVAIVNEFFARNPNVGYVKFHSHTRKTVDKFGDRYLRQFSQGDLDSYKEQFQSDKEFIAMLVTSETELTCGLDNPNIEIVPDTLDFIEKENQIAHQFSEIKTSLNIELSRYQVKKS